MNNLIVSKFGGSSFANAELTKRTVEIIKSNPNRRFIIVSAPGKTDEDTGITDLLFMCHSACANGEDYQNILDTISERFNKIIDGLELKYNVAAEMIALKNDLVSGKSLDYIGSRGEYIMGKIMSKFLGWEFVDASGIILFDRNGNLDQIKTLDATNKRLKDLEYAVIPAFYGSMPNGEIKTFARGNGGTTGALVACTMNASLCEKWSETAKVYGADPVVIPDAELIKNITYDEAAELNYIGIKIVNDDVIFMLRDAGIPLKVSSIFCPKNEYTLLTTKLPESASRNISVCIAGRRNYNIVHISKYGLNKEYGFGEKLFGLFAKYHVPCEHCLSGIYKMSIVLKTPMFDINRVALFEEIQRVVKPDSISVEKGLSLIAIIGEGMRTVAGRAQKVFSALAEMDINVLMIDHGSDDLNIIIGVNDNDYEKAVKALYEKTVVIS